MAHKLLYLIVVMSISGLIGSIFGLKNNRPKLGFWISFFLPVIGWSIIKALPPKNG
jgi:hypothetical protein